MAKRHSKANLADELQYLQSQKWGRLIVLSLVEDPSISFSRRRYWCKCDCPLEKVISVRVDGITGGQVLSCGCLRKDRQRAAIQKHEPGTIQSRTYNIWKGLRQRCHNPNDTSYEKYGAKGITVCDRWLGENGFQNFLADMGEPPTDKHSLDRIDGSKGYEPDNCRWATMTEQLRNTSRNVNITINGETMCATAWAERYGFSKGRLYWRINRTKQDPVEAVLELAKESTSKEIRTS